MLPTVGGELIGRHIDVRVFHVIQTPVVVVVVVEVGGGAGGEE